MIQKPTTTKKVYLSLTLLILSVFANANLNAQISKFESLYIYNICRFIEWPTDFNKNEFVIGIVGKNTDLKTSLKQIATSKTIQNKKISIIVVSSPEQTAKCNIVFFSKENEASINSSLPFGSNTLFFSESAGTLAKGSDINFYMADSKLKFNLSSTNLSKKSLVTSAELKQLATIVE